MSTDAVEKNISRGLATLRKKFVQEEEL